MADNSVTLVGNLVTFTPQAGYTGDPTPIQYTVQDAQGNTSNPATVTVTITAASVPPVRHGSSRSAG